jgi:hypothetical protein
MAKRTWNDEDNYKLIQRVKDNAILWDARKEEYKCSERKPAICEIEETDDSITVLHPSTQQCSDDENLLQVWNEIDYFLMNKYRTRK